MKTKVLASVLLALVVLLAQVGSAAAAPQTQDGTVTVTGEVTLIGDPQTDENGVTTVPVTIKDANGVETTVLVSPEVAGSLTVGQQDVSLTVNSGDVVPPEEPEDFHPIADLLGGFFDVSAGDVDQLHQDGFGFGLIAQALWMTADDNGDGDAALAKEILQAKQDKDFTTFFENHPEFLPEDGSAPSNWGQFKKALKDKHENLGAAHQDKADDEAVDTQDDGKGKPDKEKKPKPPKKEKKH